MLTGKQIGRIAEHVEKVLKDFPPHTYSPSDENAEKSESTGMEDWEAALKKAIDEDSNLPMYNDVAGEDTGGVTGFLIDYFDAGNAKTPSEPDPYEPH